MTNAQSEEVPWAFERPETEPAIVTPAYHDVTVTLDSLSKRAWRADGFVAHLLDSLGTRVRALASMSERGPDDYAETSYQRGLRDGSSVRAHRIQ